MLNVTPRRVHLKLLFSFMLGVALTAILFSGSRLQSGHCTGTLCNRSPARVRKLLPALALPETTTTSITHEGSVTRPSNSRSSDPSSNLSTRPSSNPSTSPSTDSSTSPSADSSTSAPTSPSMGRSTSSASATLHTTSTKYRPTKTTPNHKLSTLSLSKPGMTETYPPFTMPTQKYVPRTFPVPTLMTNISMDSRISKHTCKTGFCSDYLSPTESSHFSVCYQKCKEKKSKFGPIVNGTCHFMNGQGRLPVALASFPGSGNTWTRGLLEKVTGVCTGRNINH